MGVEVAARAEDAQVALSFEQAVVSELRVGSGVGDGGGREIQVGALVAAELSRLRRPAAGQERGDRDADTGAAQLGKADDVLPAAALVGHVGFAAANLLEA